MTERLVRYLRITSDGTVASIDPAEALAEAVARCQDPPETVVSELPDVVAGRQLLVDAVVEILDNAARYAVDGIAPVVRVTGSVDDAWSVLRFADNGFGIAADRVERAFELFRQVHRVGDMPGSGMGLPIARRCVECQGGTLVLEPGPDGGTVAEIRLPRTFIPNSEGNLKR